MLVKNAPYHLPLLRLYTESREIKESQEESTVKIISAIVISTQRLMMSFFSKGEKAPFSLLEVKVNIFLFLRPSDDKHPLKLSFLSFSYSPSCFLPAFLPAFLPPPTSVLFYLYTFSLV